MVSFFKMASPSLSTKLLCLDQLFHVSQVSPSWLENHNYQPEHGEFSSNGFPGNLIDNLKPKTVRRNSPRTAEIVDLVKFTENKIYIQSVEGNSGVIYFLL